MKTLASILLLGVVASISIIAHADGEATYNQACMACHMTGAAGAPIRGNVEHW